MQLTVDRGQLPLDWKIKTLGEVCNISTGKLNANAAVENGKYLFFTCSREIFTIDHFAFDCEAILLAGNNAVGDFNVKHYKGKFNAYQRTYVITINKGEPLLYKYLYLQVESALKDFKLKSVGAGTKFLKLDMIKNLKLHLPPLPEQKRIVAILNEAFEGIDRAIANTEKNLANSRELFESYLNAIFTQKGDGWEEKKLGEISTISYGYTEKASPEPIGPKFLRITDIQDNQVNWKTVPFCAISEKDYVKHKLSTGDIVFARTGATTGKSFLVINPPDAVCASYLIRLSLNSKDLMPDFLILYFQTKQYRELISLGISGSAQGGFNASKLAELVIPIAINIEQVHIVDRAKELFEQIQRIEAIYRQKISALNELKQSILKKAFTGELTADTPKTVKEKIAA